MSSSPATIRTPIFAKMGMNSEMVNGFLAQCSKEYPLGRVGEVDDVAKMVLYLASNDASFVTGLVAQIDGGALHTTSGASPEGFEL